MLAGAPGPAPLAELAQDAAVGRDAEMAALGRMIAGERLVTVTGLPGAGKTKTALAAAAAAAVDFADGAVLVRLEALRDEVLLPHSIVAALGLPDHFIRSPLEVLVGQLQDRHMLLVLDSCEHLLGSCAALAAALLQPCPKLQILATSREPLRVPGEAVLPVRPLRLRDAMALFGHRAAGAGLEITPEHRAVVASICVQLDKLPLAIDLAVRELAALARTAEEPLAASLSALLRTLETAGYDGLSNPGNPVVRHQSLRAAIGWSHELCTPAERLLWARLAVFTGPFGLRDAQDVCTTRGLTDEAVAVGLTLLTERSVLLADEPTGDSRHFQLPATLRGYGHQMLVRLGQDAEFGERYRRWQEGRRRGRYRGR